MTTYISTPFAYGALNSVSSVAFSHHHARIGAIYDALVGAGLVQTADTGQMNRGALPSGTASTSTTIGSFLFAMNDSLHAADPLFIKTTFLSSASARRLDIHVSTGQGTNGAGALTGQVSNLCGSGSFVTSTDPGSVQVYACKVDGYVGLLVGPQNNAITQPLLAFTVSRMKNNAGAFDAHGNVIWAGVVNASGVMCATKTAAPGQSFNNSTQYCMVPGLPGNTALLNGDKQLYPHFYPSPDIRQLWSQFTVRKDEFSSPPMAFVASPFGATPRTFLTSNDGSSRGESSGSASFGVAMLWE